MDKRIVNAYYEIEINRSTKLPVKITLVIMSGTKGGTEAKGKKIVGGKHVAFHFQYQLSSFGEVKKPSIPPEARKQLAKI